MKPTAAKLAKYQPMIRFLGKRDPASMPVTTVPKPHPCTFNGLMPGSKECLSVDQVLSKQLPFVVVPFVKPVTKQKAGVATSSKYVFTDRSLKEGELSSIFELPSKFRYKPIDEAEIEAINQGIGTL